MRNYLKYAVVLILVAAVLALGGISCGEEEGEATPTPTETPKAAYTIGGIFSLSGFNSVLGATEPLAAEMLKDKINEAGGINGHPLKLIIYDNESDTLKCTSLAERLVNEGVLAIIGPTGTGDSMYAKKVATDAQVPLISAASGSVIVDPAEENKWIFNTPQLDYVAIERIYTYLQEQGITKVALICDTAGFGAAGRAWLIKEEMQDKYGLTIVADERYGTYDVDMQAQLQNIKKANPEAVVCWGTNPGPAVIARNMRTLEMTAPLFCSHGIAFQEFIDNAGQAANGVIFPCGKLPIVDELLATDPQKEFLLTFRADFEAEYGVGKANTFAGHAYDALSMIVMALEKMPEGLDLATARAFIRDEVEKTTNFAGTAGVFNISPQNHNGLPRDAKEGMVMVKIEDMKWTWLE